MAARTETLRILHTHVIDSRDGYRHARGYVESGKGARFLDRCIEEREDFHVAIHRALADEGVELSEDGSTAASVHRGLFKVRDAISSGNMGVFAECARGDSDLLETYEEAIDVTSGDLRWQFLVEQRAKVAASITEAGEMAA